MDNVRYNISPCTASEVEAFVGKIDKDVFVPNGVVKSTERSHYDRYSFLADEQRVAVVYDITASIVSITARADLAKRLLDLFDPVNKSVKRSTVPAQGVKPVAKSIAKSVEKETVEVSSGDKRAKLFVAPERIKRRGEFVPVPTVLATSRGVIVTTDEIYPPQVSKKHADASQKPTAPTVIQKRPVTSYGESALIERPRSEQSSDNDKPCGIAISVGARQSAAAGPRRAVISFGSEDDGKAQKSELKINTRGGALAPVADDGQKRKRGRPKKEVRADEIKPPQQDTAQSEQPSQKRKRGRPKKVAQSEVKQPQPDATQEKPQATTQLEYKNGYSVKNYPMQSLMGAIKRLREYGKTVITDGTEFIGSPQEVKSYTVTDAGGQKVILRYATKRMTLQLQGKRSELFGEVMAQVSYDSDYSSALENYVQKDSAESEPAKKNKVTDVQNKLKKRLPTAYGFLSEQSRIDFSYGIHDFEQTDLHLSDYSVLLVPAFRGLECFIFDLQAARDIKVKMIGQAFDKDDSGRYVLKSGYVNRLNSVIYPEVLVALYSEYFAQRNFFAHSDNTGGNMSRSIPEHAAAKKIFEHLLDVVEYNAKKLKEIGFVMPGQKNNRG